MPNDYITNFENIALSALFICFIGILIILVSILIISLVLLMIGCLIKSQKLKSKFIIVAPGLLIGIVLLLVIPIIFLNLKKVI